MMLAVFNNKTMNQFAQLHLETIFKYCTQEGRPVQELENLDDCKGVTVLTHGAVLEPHVITRLKENDNKVVSLDINDHTLTEGAYRGYPEFHDIDLVFKFAGIQNTAVSWDTVIDDDLNYSMKPVEFPFWEEWHKMDQAGKMESLPYSPWAPIETTPQPWDQRTQKVLVRGGHHFGRFHLLLHLIKRGLADPNSAFFAYAYAQNHCDDCKQAWQTQNRMTYEYIDSHEMSCRLQKPYDFGFHHPHNGCVPRYLDIARLFSEKHGPIDLGLVEQVFNARLKPSPWVDGLLNKYGFFADHKWIFSVYAPPRFWEAAAAGTVSLLPRRTNDQRYFPEMADGEHYVTYSDDFGDIDEVVSWVGLEQFEHISQNLVKMYDHWIKPTKYELSTNLLEHIVRRIEAIG